MTPFASRSRPGASTASEFKIGEAAEPILQEPKEASTGGTGPDRAVGTPEEGAESGTGAVAGTLGAEGIAQAKDFRPVAVEADKAVVGGKPGIAIAGGEHVREGFFGETAFGTPTADGKVGEPFLSGNGVERTGQRQGDEKKGEDSGAPKQAAAEHLPGPGRHLSNIH